MYENFLERLIQIGAWWMPGPILFLLIWHGQKFGKSDLLKSILTTIIHSEHSKPSQLLLGEICLIKLTSASIKLTGILS